MLLCNCSRLVQVHAPYLYYIMLSGSGDNFKKIISTHNDSGYHNY